MTAAMLHPAVGESVLTFRVAGEALALPAASVAEIARAPEWTRVPHAPASLLGVANLRGTVLPVVSLAALLGRAGAPVSGTSRVVVLGGAAPVGLLVDAVAALSAAGDARVLDPDSLLERDFGPMLRRAAARPAVAAAGSAESEAEAAGEMLALIGLRLADQEYALPLDRVAEVLRLPDTVAVLPRTDGAMMGVMAFRAGLLPLVSLRVLLGLPAPTRGAATRVVVTALGGVPIGLVVDGVSTTMTVPASTIDPVPPVLTRGAGEAQIEGICRLEGGKRLVCILAPAGLFDLETVSRVRAQGNGGESRMTGPETGGAIEQFLVFRLGEEQYGLPVAAVDEVVRRPDALTRLPHAPDFVEGVINLRGRVVPLINATCRFGAGGKRDGRRVIVVTTAGLQAGFVVDSVSEVLSVRVSELRPAPEFETEGAKLFDRVAIERDGRMILLISPEGLLLQAERDLLAALAPALPGRPGSPATS